MYLFVYIFLVLSVLGLYTQLFVIRAARLNESQTAVAESMMVWHRSVYKIILNFDPPTNGCYLGMAITGKSACTTQPVQADFPAGYNFVQVNKFKSILYKIDDNRYLVTYVSPYDTKLGYSAPQIMQQMANAGFPKTAYGASALVSCNGGLPDQWLVSRQFIGTNNICYPTYSADDSIIFVPNGSVGIVSVLGGLP